MSSSPEGTRRPPEDLVTCAELVELITDYLEGALAPRELQRFEGHLAICDPCRAYLAQMRETIQALGHLPDERMEPQARDTLLDVFRDWKRDRESST
jgi:anti-sigma factor RsiW